MPRVSVLIPAYRAERFIAEAIRSVLSQDGVDLELIVADNASDDRTAEIVRGFDDPRLRLIVNAENVGAIGNFNGLLAQATGRYVKLLPADDVLQPGALARQVAVLEQDAAGALALVFGARTITDEKGKRLATRGLGGGDRRLSGAWLATQSVRAGTNVVGEPGGVLFRRAASERAGLFDGQQPFVVDLDYWLRLLAHGDGYYLAQPQVAFRVASGSWSSAIGGKQSRQFIEFVDRLQARGPWRFSAVDVMRGRVRARLNNLLRLVFYKLFVR